jgi:pyruvate kinase
LKADETSSKSLEAVISRLAEIRCSLVKLESDFKAQRSGVNRAWRKSAENLLHYMALRHHDVRLLQEELAILGLSSLGRSEAHVMSTLDAVLRVLHRLAGRAVELPAQGEHPGFNEGEALLAAHTEALLGPPPTQRGVRIMVTMSSEAADDYGLVRDLLSHGMNCMRINCGHDTADEWARMIEHRDRARREIGLPCKILMDLGGPKLRTGPIEPGPQVTVWHPKRDSLGRVIEPVRVWLAPAGTGGTAPANADVALPVGREWLGAVQPGERIHFKDARHKRRVLEIVGAAGNGRWARCEQTAYVTPNTLLSRIDTLEAAKRDTQVGALPPIEQSLVLRRGDRLLLTADPVPGKPASFDASGKVLAPASISCTLPEIFPQICVGERVWFDDGKIGGIVSDARAEALTVEINHASVKGDRLGADKGINLPDTKIDFPAITPKDLQDLRFVVTHADLVGMSFVRHERDIYELQARVAELGGDNLGIVLKIETRQGFERLPNLMLAAMRQPTAGVMIARGDLAVECGFERTAEVQEEILWICEAAHMPVIWATQVLESLAKKGRPSRAEITDAAMGERAECVMLNKGPHIIEAVSALDDILHRMQDHQAKKSARLRPLRLMMQDSE